jgi:hypothetical protein
MWLRRKSRCREGAIDVVDVLPWPALPLAGLRDTYAFALWLHRWCSRLLALISLSRLYGKVSEKFEQQLFVVVLLKPELSVPTLTPHVCAATFPRFGRFLAPTEITRKTKLLP